MAIETLVAATITAVGRILSALISRRHKSGSPQAQRNAANEGSVPSHWHGILPPNTKYEFGRENKRFVPIGSQSFSFEYSPEGHANPLNLKGTLVRADIQFTCRIGDLDKAFMGADGYGLNILQPKFLTLAREILERYPVTKLRAARRLVAAKIVSELSPQFAAHGFILEEVTIGSLDKLQYKKK